LNQQKFRGHFGYVLKKGTEGLYQTTVTSQLKPRAREREAAKKAAIIAATEQLTGSPVSVTARAIDGVKRRWTGVGNGRSDG
jgi:hypothetical protein